MPQELAFVVTRSLRFQTVSVPVLGPIAVRGSIMSSSTPWRQSTLGYGRSRLDLEYVYEIVWSRRRLVVHQLCHRGFRRSYKLAIILSVFEVSSQPWGCSKKANLKPIGEASEACGRDFHKLFGMPF